MNEPRLRTVDNFLDSIDVWKMQRAINRLPSFWHRFGLHFTRGAIGALIISAVMGFDKIIYLLVFAVFLALACAKWRLEL